VIVERVYVRDESVVAVTLKANYHVVLGHKMNGPTEMPVDPFVYTCGSDGLGHPSGYVFWSRRDEYRVVIRAILALPSVA
jgi:hypothetical protein